MVYMDPDCTRKILFVTRFVIAVFIFVGGYDTSGFSKQLKDIDTVSLSLNEAIDLALRANRNLIQAGYGLRSQILSLQSSRSEFDLKINPLSQIGIADGQKSAGFGVDINKKFDVGVQASLKPEVERADDLYTGRAGVSLHIPLLRGLGKAVNLSNVYHSQFSRRAAERSMHIARVNVVLETVSAVYDIKKQSQLVELFEFQTTRLAGHAETARIKERVGLATPIDIYRAEIRLKDAEDSLASARESVANVKDRLKLILALPLEKEIHTTTPLAFEPIRMDPDEAVKVALSHRIELEQKADDIQEAERQAGIAKHNLLPRLDLVVDYDRFDSANEFRESMGLSQDRWAIYLTSDTDWSRTQEKLDYRQHFLNLKNVRLSLDQTQDEIARDVRRQLKALDKSYQRIQIRREQLHQADGKRALAIIKFNYGMTDNFDVIEAETERQRAQVDLISTEIDYIVGTYRMRSVLGTLIER